MLPDSFSRALQVSQWMANQLEDQSANQFHRLGRRNDLHLRKKRFWKIMCDCRRCFGRQQVSGRLAARISGVSGISAVAQLPDRLRIQLDIRLVAHSLGFVFL